jgi:hypothetical protein
MPMCMHPVLIASRAQSVPVSQPGGKVLKSTLTSTARAAGLASAAERPESQARASQGSHKVTRIFSTFSTFSSNSILIVVVLAGEGEGTSNTQGVADAFRIPVEVCITGEGVGIVPEFPEGGQKFLTFRMSSCALQPDMRAPQGSRRRSGGRQRDA